MLNPVLPAPRSRRIQTARNAVDVILNARSVADLRLYEWEDRGKTPTGKTRWYDTDTKKTRYQISKPGTGRGKKAAVDATAAPAEGEQPQAKQPAQKKAGAPRKPKVDHNEVGDRIEKMLGTDFADRDVGALREELLSLTGAQIEELRKRFPFKGGRTKADKAGRLAGHVGSSRKSKPEPMLESTSEIGLKRDPNDLRDNVKPIRPGSPESVKADAAIAEERIGYLTKRLGSMSESAKFGESTGMKNERAKIERELSQQQKKLAKLKGSAQPAPEATPAPEKPARKPRAVKQPVRQPEPARKPPIAIGPEDVAGIIGEENPAQRRKSVGEVVDDRDARVQAHAERVAREQERRKKPTPNPREQRSRSGLGQAPQVQPKPQPRTAPSSLTRNRLAAGVRSALPAGKPQAKRTGRGILNARNPVDVVLHARSPQQARPLLYAWLRTASKRNPSKTVWVNSTNPKDRRYQEAMPKQRATQSVENLPPQEHLQQILEAPYRVADYYLTSLQTRLRRMRPGALAALRMQFNKEG